MLLFLTHLKGNPSRWPLSAWVYQPEDPRGHGVFAVETTLELFVPYSWFVCSLLEFLSWHVGESESFHRYLWTEQNMISYALALVLKALPFLFVLCAPLSAVSPCIQTCFLDFLVCIFDLVYSGFFFFFNIYVFILKLWMQEKTTYPSGKPIIKRASFWFS